MFRKLLVHIIILLFFVPFFARVTFGQGDIEIKSEVDRAKITIGDRIRYSVIVTRSTDVKLQMPSLAANLGMFELTDYEVHEPIEEAGKVIDKTDYIISTFETGEFEIPPLTIQYSTEKDTTLKILRTEPIKIVVASLNPDQQGDIRDIKAPLEISRNWAKIIRFIVAGVLGVAVIVLVILIIRRHRQGKSIIPKKIKPPRPPYEIALENLNKLLESDLLETGQLKQFYSEISEIIRYYIEGRFFIIALEMTTFQLLQNMYDAEIEDEYCETIKEFLELCDLVKFAKHIPGDKEHNKVISLAYDFINRTKLVILEEEEAENDEKNLDHTKNPEQKNEDKPEPELMLSEAETDKNEGAAT